LLVAKDSKESRASNAAKHDEATIDGWSQYPILERIHSSVVSSVKHNKTTSNEWDPGEGTSSYLKPQGNMGKLNLSLMATVALHL